MLTNHLRRQLRGAAVDRLKVPQGNKSMQRAMRTCMALTAICCGATVVPAPAHAQSSVDKDLYGELWSNFNFDNPRTIQQYSFDTAVAYIVRPNFQIDAGMNIGLNRDTPALQVYMGAAAECGGPPRCC